MPNRFFYSPAVSPLHDAAAVGRLLAGLAATLARGGGTPVAAEEAPTDRPLLHVVLTGGTERLVLERLRARAAGPGGSDREPVLLAAHPTHNSLPACLEILARVRADGGTGRIVFLSGEAGDPDRLSEVVHLADVAIALRRARLGAVGPPSEWLVASSHDAATVRDSWGPELVAVPMSELTDRLAATPTDRRLARGLVAGARESDVAQGAVLDASALRGALAALVDAHRLSALTVRCFDLVTGLGTSGCLALSQLADDGIPSGCEGDVPSAVALLWLHLLTGAPAWMANPARIDAGRGELVLAHCTVPRRLVRGYDVQTHFESGLGVALGGDLVPGPVTLVRLGGTRLERLWLAEGEVVGSPHDPGLCRTQATLHTDPAALDELLRAPLGNHVVLVPGHRAALLRASRELILGAT